MCKLPDKLDPVKGFKWAKKKIMPKPPDMSALTDQINASAEASKKIAAGAGDVASADAQVVAQLRRKRAGAASNVLTGALGIPSGSSSNSKMGGGA